MTRLHASIVTLGALAASVAIASLLGDGALAALAVSPIALGPLLWPLTAALALLLSLLQHQGFVFHWRQESTKVSLDEAGLFVGLLVLPAAHVVLATSAASLLNQIVHRRALGKAAFNVAQYTNAALATAAACAALHALGVPAPWYAVPAPAIFYTLTAFQVSLLFAGIERTSAARVFKQRFGLFVLIGSALGTSLGLVVVALFALHPLAVVAAVPVFLYLRRFGRLSEWADDEIKTHRLVATVSADVAGRADLDRVADRILSTCHELFDCGEASLVLARGGPDGGPRVWRQTFAKSEGHGGVAAEIRGSDGENLGSLSVFPQPGQSGYGEREQQLLRTVGAAAAAAAANAEAIRDAEELNVELAQSEERYRKLFDAQKVLEEELRRSMAQQHETIKRLENMNRELEQFTLWTTHDMREPLRSIGTIAQFLHEDIGAIETAEARDMARRISEGADRLKERVKALHAFSLIVQRDEEFEDVDVQRVMEHVVSGLETKIAEKGATVVFPSAEFPTVRAQPHRLDQVFANLVENALKYGRARGAIVELAFEESASDLRFFVRDNGPGIPSGYHERIFQLFQRGPKNGEGGSGAGLAIVKRIAEQHGGRAWVESREGEGACFVLALPKPAPVPLVSKAF